MMVPTSVAGSHRKEIVELAIKSRLPMTYRQSQFVETGGLMSYGVSIVDLNRRAATYIDKILKGAKPADLPVEQPTKFEFVIQSQSCQGDWPDDSPQCFGQSRSSYPMNFESKNGNLKSKMLSDSTQCTGVGGSRDRSSDDKHRASGVAPTISLSCNAAS